MTIRMMKARWQLSVFLLVLSGSAILLYPVVSNWLAARDHTQVIEEYKQAEEQLSDTEREAEYLRAREYNERLTGTAIEDPFAALGDQQQHEEYLSILNLNGVMGYISIPVIDVNLPVYHTTTAEVLKKGVGHLEFSAFPVGGESSHAVLTAHRGLPSAKLFTDLNRLEIGDIFTIHVLGETLVYEVDQILVTEPEDTKALNPVAGKDYVTLVTCTPYAVNSHRLYVRGERREDADMEDIAETAKRGHRGRLFWLSGMIILILLILWLVYKNRRSRLPR